MAVEGSLAVVFKPLVFNKSTVLLCSSPFLIYRTLQLTCNFLNLVSCTREVALFVMEFF